MLDRTFKLLKFLRSNNIIDLSLEYSVGNVEAETVLKKLGFNAAIITANAKLSDLEENYKQYRA